MTAVHVVVPDSIDDPARPSGGNLYDRRICRGLATMGWSVSEHAVPGSWPRPDAAARVAVVEEITAIPNGSVVLIDGLIGSSVPEIVLSEAGRLRLVILVHMPLGEGPPSEVLDDASVGEHAVLSAAAAVVTSSSWTRQRLVDRYALRPALVHIAEPGVDPAEPAHGSASGGELLCVAAVTPNKGHDVLLAALATLPDLAWRCVCVGALSRDPDFVDHLQCEAQKSEIDDRVRFTGPLTGDKLAAAYAAADALVLASRGETYGMVVSEALARGLPVVATDVGGLPEALGQSADGRRPGLLVQPGDSAALAEALREWLVDSQLRQRLREAARERRQSLAGWSVTSGQISRVLESVAA